MRPTYLNKKFDKANYKGAYYFLLTVMLLRIISYFMLWEEASITQVFKAGLRAVLTSILIVTLVKEYIHSKQLFPKIHNSLPIILYASYLLFGLASFLWTTSIAESLLQWIMDFEGFIFSLLFIITIYYFNKKYENNLFEIHQFLAPAITLIAIWFFYGMYADPDRFYRLTHGGEVARLGGFIINPNELGMLLVVGIASLVPSLVKENKYRLSIIIYVLFLTYLLVLTGSRSSFFAMLLVFTLYALQHPSPVFKIGLFAGIVLSIPLIGYSIFVKQGDTEEVMNATGRLPFWQDLLTYNFPKEPFIGFGYMRIDYSDKFESLNAYAGAMTHNTFMQVLLGLGLCGLLIVILQMSSFFNAVKLCKNKNISNNAMLIFIPLIINSFTEFGIFGETNYGIIFYLFLVISISLEPIKRNERIYNNIRSNGTAPNLPVRPITT